MSESEQGQYSVGKIEVGMLTGVRDQFTGPNGEWLESSDVVARLTDLQTQLTAANERADAQRRLREEAVERDAQDIRDLKAELALLRPRASLAPGLAAALAAMLLAWADVTAIADADASLVHDYLWSKNGISLEAANKAIWEIHRLLRPAPEPAAGSQP